MSLAVNTSTWQLGVGADVQVHCTVTVPFTASQNRPVHRGCRLRAKGGGGCRPRPQRGRPKAPKYPA